MQMWLGRAACHLSPSLARSEPFHSVCASLLLLLLFLFCFMLVCVLVLVVVVVLPLLLVVVARCFLDFYCKNANVGRF